MRLSLKPANSWSSFWARTNPGPNPTLRRRIVAVTPGLFYAGRMMSYVVPEGVTLREEVIEWRFEDESVYLVNPGVDLATTIYEVVAINDSKPVGGFTGRNIIFFGLAKMIMSMSEEERTALLPQRWHELTPETERFTIPT